MKKILYNAESPDCVIEIGENAVLDGKYNDTVLSETIEMEFLNNITKIDDTYYVYAKGENGNIYCFSIDFGLPFVFKPNKEDCNGEITYEDAPFFFNRDMGCKKYAISLDDDFVEVF